MNYYPFHVGDYTAHTAHLDLLEDLAYRRMLDLYYLRECALPHDPSEVARLIRMRGNVAEVTAVLREFFTEVEGGWVNGRCEAEILRMKDKQTKAKASAEASVAARRAKAGGHRSTPAERTFNERPTDAELPTPTPTPKNKDTAASRRRTKVPEDFHPNDAGLKAAELAGIDVDSEVAQFVDRHTATGDVMADWQAAWRTWVRKAVEFGRAGKRTAKAVQKSPQWALDAGFPTVWEAENALCFERNAHEFRDGQRIRVPA